MAAKTQIGAVIGIEGAYEFNRAIKSISQELKHLASDTKLVESSFNGQAKSISDISRLQTALQGELSATAKKLYEQRTALELMEQAYKDGGSSSETMRKAIIDLGTETNKTETELYELENRLKELKSLPNQITTLWRNNTSEWGELFEKVGGTLTKYVTLPLTALGGVGVKTFSDWQSAFTGVKKTVEGTPEQLDAVAQGITDIALSTASSREDIAAVAEVAGQLGVGAEDIVDFTKVMVMLGDTTNVNAEDAATSLARLLNITKKGSEDAFDDIEQVGSAIVYLGNNFATSESEIISMANRLAAGGTLAGLTTQEILGLSAAMSSVGITAEAGGTAMNQTLTEIEKQFAQFTAGEESNFERIAEIANMSADEFAQAWETKPAEAIEAFIRGLGTLDEKGESATLVLDELGMAGIRQSNMLKSLSLASDVLSKSMDYANEGYDKNVALTDEASKRYGDFNTKVNQLKESFKLFSSTIGETLVKILVPIVEGLTKVFTTLTNWWNKLSPFFQTFIAVLGAIFAAIGPILAIVGQVMVLLAKLEPVITAIKVAMAAAGVAASSVVAIVLGVIAAVAALIAIILNWDEVKTFVINLCTNIGNFLQDFFAQVGEWLSQAGSFIWDVLTNVGSFILDKVRYVLEWLVSQFLTFVLVTLPDFFTKVKNGFKTMMCSHSPG